MKVRMISVCLLMLVGSYANAANVLIGNGISWTYSMTGLGTDTGTITLTADVTGASFGWGNVGYLSGIGIKNLGDPETSDFKITSVSLANWSANNDELNSSGSACDAGGATSDKRGCAYADSVGDRIATTDGNPLAIVLGVDLDSGVLSDGFHFKVRWENLDGSKTGSLISDDFSTVPLPAAAWLFGSALMGLTVVARRRDSKNRLSAV